MTFNFERNNGLWKHNQNNYSREKLISHYKESHIGEITSGIISLRNIRVHQEMSLEINTIREEYLERQKERKDFFKLRN